MGSTCIKYIFLLYYRTEVSAVRQYCAWQYNLQQMGIQQFCGVVWVWDRISHHGSAPTSRRAPPVGEPNGEESPRDPAVLSLPLSACMSFTRTTSSIDGYPTCYPKTTSFYTAPLHSSTSTTRIAVSNGRLRHEDTRAFAFHRHRTVPHTSLHINPLHRQASYSSIFAYSPVQVTRKPNRSG